MVATVQEQVEAASLKYDPSKLSGGQIIGSLLAGCFAPVLFLVWALIASFVVDSPVKRKRLRKASGIAAIPTTLVVVLVTAALIVAGASSKSPVQSSFGLNTGAATNPQTYVPSPAHVENDDQPPLAATPTPTAPTPTTLPAAETIALPTSCQVPTTTNQDPAANAKLSFETFLYALNTGDQACLGKLYSGTSTYDVDSWVQQQMQLAKQAVPYQLVSWQVTKTYSLFASHVTTMVSGDQTLIDFSYRVVGTDNELTESHTARMGLMEDSTGHFAMTVFTLNPTN